MILTKLSDYYDRLRNEKAVAEPGFERKEIPFIIILDRNGNVKGLRDTREGEGRKKVARSFLVPQGEKKTSGIRANLLWDTPNYVLGHNPDDPQKGEKQLLAFRERLAETFEGLDDPGIVALRLFLDSRRPPEQETTWGEVLDTGGNMSFMLENDDCLICQRPAVVDWLRQRLGSSTAPRQQCLISGRQDVPAVLHTSIKGVWGAQSSGANIVSFNLDAFRSFGKDQGLNAPVGTTSEFAYTTALNTLLAKGSTQRMQVGDASTVFWAKERHPFEQEFSDLFAEPGDRNGPDPRISAVRSLLSAAQSGVYPPEDDLPFFVLGLSPNAARISVRFWLEGSVKEFKEQVCRHFEDTNIVHGPNEPEYLSIFRLLVCTCMEGKVDNIQPNLAGDFMKSILKGAPYPRTLLAAVIRRLKAEQSKRGSDGRVLQNVTYPRAALIKGILVRNSRFYHQNSNNKEVDVSLDRENYNIGYLLGRLFAVLERSQQAALGDLNATVRDRFYGAASTNPITAFPRLVKLNNHHLTKIENRGYAINLEREIGSIMDGITTFPAYLSLDDQGRFAIGYYHQRQHFFTKVREENHDQSNQ